MYVHVDRYFNTALTVISWCKAGRGMFYRYWESWPMEEQ